MKYLITFFITLEVLTIVLCVAKVQQVERHATAYEWEIEKLYFGFCQDVRASGLDHGANYHRLCEV